MKTRARNIQATALGVVLTLLAIPAWAAPRVEILISQAREVVEARGSTRTVKLVPAQTASPGDVVQYTLTYTNRGDEAARDAVIDDPIPKGTTFVSDGTAGTDAQIMYSIDGGVTFAPAEQLTREVRLPSGHLERRRPEPAEFTHLRWIVKQIPPGTAGSVTFRVRVD